MRYQYFTYRGFGASDKTLVAESPVLSDQASLDAWAKSVQVALPQGDRELFVDENHPWFVKTEEIVEDTPKPSMTVEEILVFEKNRQLAEHHAAIERKQRFDEYIRNFPG